MLETDFDPIEDIQTLTSDSNLCVIRTGKLIPTLKLMQGAWRRLCELIPDDEVDENGNIKEYNILTYNK